MLRRPATEGGFGRHGVSSEVRSLRIDVRDERAAGRSPAKRTTVPRSIWKTEAEVRINPTFSIVVAQASHEACAWRRMFLFRPSKRRCK